jgi:predicted RecA/RadA family phage recombinase
VSLTTFKHIGDVIDYTPSSALSAGEIVVEQDLIGQVVNDIAANEPGSLRIEGVINAPKLSTDVVAIGDVLYWDAGNSRCTKTASTHKIIGKASQASANGNSRVFVKLTPQNSSATAETISARIGVSGAMADGNGNAGNTVTYFPLSRLPVASTLTKVEFYNAAAAAHDVSIMVAVPSADGWDVSEHQVVNVSDVGVKTFTVADETLDPLELPANAMVGFYCSLSGAMRFYNDASDSPVRYWHDGYCYASGKASGSTAMVAYTYYNELKFAWEATAVRGSQTYAVDESFTGSTQPWQSGLPSGGASWTFGGSAVPSTAGIANRMYWQPSSNANKQTLQVDFQFTGATGIAAIGKEPCLNTASVDYGSILAADIALNQLTMYNPWNTGGTLPVVRHNSSLVNLTLAEDTPYRLELIIDGKTTTARITNIGSGVFDEFTYGPDNLQGYGHGRPAIFAISAGVQFDRVRWWMDDMSPLFVIYGDSITEGSGVVDHQDCFAELLVDQVSGNGWYSGDGGVTAVSCTKAFIQDTTIIMPKYAIFYGGANNSGSDAERDNYAIDMGRFVTAANALGVTPLVMLPTPDSDSAKDTRLDVMRAAALANGVDVIRSDLALGAPDGSTYNAGLMNDSTHPNAAGHAALAARCNSDAPEAFGG